eukprot:9200512-Pyramimonas_sp.AAC.1
MIFHTPLPADPYGRFDSLVVNLRSQLRHPAPPLSLTRGRRDDTDRAVGQGVVPQSPFPGKGSADACFQAALRRAQQVDVDYFPSSVPVRSYTPGFWTQRTVDRS